MEDEVRIYYQYDNFPSVAQDCPRFPPLHSSVRCPYPGLMVEMLNVITKEAGLRIVPLVKEQLCNPTYMNCNPRPGFPWGVNTADLLRNRTIDLNAASWQITDKRLEEFDFSERLYMTQTSLIRRVHDNHFSSMFSFFQSYDYRVWMSIFCVWALQWICCILCQRVGSHNEKRNSSVFDTAWQILRLQLLQYRELHNKLNASSKLSMSIFAFFQCYVLLGLFSAFILASLIKPRINRDNPIDLLINGIGSGRYQLAGMQNAYAFFVWVNESQQYPYIGIRQSLEKNPFKFTNSHEEAFQLALNSKTLVFQQTDQYSYYLLHKHCELEALEQDMPLFNAHLMMIKGHPLLSRINQVIKDSKGKLKMIRNKYDKLFLQFKCPEKDKIRPLKIMPYFGASIVCIVLIIFAIFTLIVEFISFKVCKRVNENY